MASKDSVASLKGVGKQAAETLQEMKIETIHDLIMTFPYRHEDFQLKDLADTPHNERVTVEGRVESEPSVLFLGKNKSRTQVQVMVGRHLVKAIFFNQPYVKAKLRIGEVVTLSGKWDRGRQVITVTNHSIGPRTGGVDFEPVYSLKGSIFQKTFRKLMRQALDLAKDDLEDCLPERFRTAYHLVPVQDALEWIHFPTDGEALKQARRRFVYEELLIFQLKMQALRKKNREEEGGSFVDYDLNRLKHFIDTLPFDLTDAQKRVVNEICRDLKEPFRMNRLLQGDVGSGKTVVAAIALYAVVTAGMQGALMAPTEILAEQHANTLAQWFEPFEVNIALLTGSVKGKKRQFIIDQLADGKIDILIGTHALIQPNVQFKKLGLVITDEQHRFGVDQRRVLKDKGYNPDVLFMTATPIPRTLAISAFGEMDVSVIDEMPVGRKEIQTYWMKKEMFGKIVGRMEKELAEGRQAYVICPLIEESDKLDYQNAVDLFQQLSSYFHEKHTVGLMHGRLSGDEKEQTMRAFTEGSIEVLVSTTVVEVGVNVPNATFMLIYDAERFGLSQLHQLRGRVGRGSDQSYCVLLADPKTEVGKERMTSMTETNDGFVLAEKDLQLRGPGDFFGRKQSGVPEFKMADLVHDYRALETARRDAEALVNSQEFWTSEETRCLREQLEDSGALATGRLD
ncbi:ATP-dependent DNA helicase RecG [Planococcus shenhongbingii]|uniref:ATP-dependent DNA helicase RecG n=1 Tax=Planococcus shenhongbingii TaxID=3058398 RepID=A0ABT8N8M4_9BACL|nr:MULTISPECIES: ATP-dependent DNA helicase RecG [unclassified Planococcus (in: firmicutes)]MDN7244221.1 ATP-dependent DNA helicase RecG [Planococcus sp. N017]WKA60488.1 ATP-dependent DNA helicase RecG [Planococcus sp. N016]